MAKISNRIGLSWLWVILMLAVHAGVSLFGLYSLAFFSLGRLGGLSTPPPRVLMEFGINVLLFGPVVCALVALGGYVFGRKSIFLTFALLPPIYAIVYLLVLMLVP